MKLLLLCLVAWPSLLAAQPIANPTVVEFPPSPDHQRVVNEEPLVDFYVLEFYTVGGTDLLQSLNIGKPSPEGDGLIRYRFQDALRTWQAPNVTYEARVVAVGRGGSGPSTPSNPFTFPNATVSTPAPGPPCTYTLTPPSRILSTSASTGLVIVAAADGCAWSAVSSASWLTVTAGATGLGNGMISYAVADNPSQDERIATLAVGESTFALSQTGGCIYTMTPTSQGFNPPGGNGTIAVTAPPGCAWTATRSGSWITIVDGASGGANGTVTYSVAANGGSGTRVGTLTIAGQPFVITQSAGTAPSAPAGARVVIVK